MQKNMRNVRELNSMCCCRLAWCPDVGGIIVGRGVNVKALAGRADK